ncbi:MAG: hypothetical protein Q9M91_04900 [Candidatus Dojkabacteria bacterium]|nr:hypothetical protein [Candidatus Dojkabacteria bacterium]
MLENYELKKIGMGLLGRVYKIKDTTWVIKEGRWDLSFDFLLGIKLPVPARFLEFILKPFNFKFLPNPKEILKQYGEYLEFAQYFGYFETDKQYYHPNREVIFRAQKTIRDSLLLYKPRLEEKYGFTFDPKIDEVLNNPETRYHNFLPKEYLIIAKSISKENKGRITSIIFQEFVEGKLLRDIPDKKLQRKLKEQLILMCYLILIMHLEKNWLPDTRPRYFLFEAYNWLTKTENIIVTEKELKFIDTRWMWDTDTNFIRKGMVIPNLVINKSKSTIQSLLNELD